MDRVSSGPLVFDTTASSNIFLKSDVHKPLTTYSTICNMTASV